MKNKIKILNRLLEKYKIKSPLSLPVQDYILSRQKKSLIKILKKLGRYNPVFGSILSLFFLLKKSGIGFSVIQSTIILATATAITAASVSTGVYIGVKNITSKESPKIEKIEKKIKPDEIKKQLSLHELVTTPVIKKIQNKKILQTSHKTQIKKKQPADKSNRLAILSPLDKLRARGKPLSMLYMVDGSKIAGNVVSQDDKILTLDTGDGHIIIPKDDIIRRKIIN